MSNINLLADFDLTAKLVKGFVAGLYDADFAESLHSDARREFETIIPLVPRIKGLRARLLNVFLLYTAQEVALYRAMREHGKSPEETWLICHQAIRLRMRTFPRWKAWLLRLLLFSPLTRWIFSRRARHGERHRFGDFEVAYVVGDGSRFDIGVDYMKCGNLELVRKLGAEEFAPYVCLSDIPLSDSLGWGLERSQTLADGCDHCDFRFKKGGPTRITSKTPAVQEIIYSIQTTA